MSSQYSSVKLNASIIRNDFGVPVGAVKTVSSMLEGNNNPASGSFTAVLNRVSSDALNQPGALLRIKSNVLVKSSALLVSLLDIALELVLEELLDDEAFPYSFDFCESHRSEHTADNNV